MAFLNNVNISKKLTIGFAVVVTVVAVMCAAVFASLMSIKSAVALNNHAAEQVEVFNQALMARVERQNGNGLAGDHKRFGAFDETGSVLAQIQHQGDGSLRSRERNNPDVAYFDKTRRRGRRQGPQRARAH